MLPYYPVLEAKDLPKSAVEWPVIDMVDLCPKVWAVIKDNDDFMEHAAEVIHEARDYNYKVTAEQIKKFGLWHHSWSDWHLQTAINRFDEWAAEGSAEAQHICRLKGKLYDHDDGQVLMSPAEYEAVRAVDDRFDPQPETAEGWQWLSVFDDWSSQQHRGKGAALGANILGQGTVGPDTAAFAQRKSINAVARFDPMSAMARQTPGGRWQVDVSPAKYSPLFDTLEEAHAAVFSIVLQYFRFLSGIETDFRVCAKLQNLAEFCENRARSAFVPKSDAQSGLHNSFAEVS